MKKLETIAQNILSNNSDFEDTRTDNSDSYFSNPSRGEIDYFSYNNFNNKKELTEIFDKYLSDLNVSIKQSEQLAEIAYNLKESNTDDSGELSEFIYIMS